MLSFIEGKDKITAPLGKRFNFALSIFYRISNYCWEGCKNLWNLTFSGLILDLYG